MKALLRERPLTWPPSVCEPCLPYPPVHCLMARPRNIQQLAHRLNISCLEGALFRITEPTELGEERRIAAAILSAGWSLSAVAVMDTVNAELLSQKPQPPPA